MRVTLMSPAPGRRCHFHFLDKETEALGDAVTYLRTMANALIPSTHPGLHVAWSPGWPQTTWAILVCFVGFRHVCESTFEGLCFKATRFKVRLIGSAAGAGGEASLAHVGNEEGGAHRPGLSWTRTSTWFLRRGGPAPCPRCPRSPTHGPETRFSMPSRGASISHGQMGSRGMPSRQEVYPHSSPKDRMFPGWD